jgi:hypothetical protein
MATWRKVIVSGSNAELNHISSSGNFVPVETDGGALGSAGLNWSDLFLDSGAVVNFDNGNVTLTHESGKIVTSGDVSGSVFTTGSFGRLELAGDAVINGNLTFGDANTDSVSFGAEIDSNLIPNEDDTYDLGSATKAWQDLFLEGDITLTDAGSVKTSAGNLTVDSEAANLVLDGHTGVDIDATNSGKVSIDGAGGIDIGVASDVAIDINSSTLDIDASGNVTIDASGGSINIGGGSSGRAITIGHTTSEVTIGDNITVSGNATIAGNLDVNGTLTTIDTTNLRVADRFILAASGSTSGDGGLVVNTNNAGSGSAFFYDDSAVRWGLTGQNETGGSQITATPRQYITTVSQSAADPGATPNDFGADDATRRGMIHINSSTGDIFIFS